MDKSEVKGHKMYEHMVPVSPFEEVKDEENREEKSSISKYGRDKDK